MTAPFILITIFGLSLLVIVHEGGHYLAARAFGMRVTRFSIGFGPVIVSYRPKDSPTTFQICAIPFLAYVMIAGMNPAEDVDPNDDSLFPNKGVFARIVTIFGGPFANYLAASAMVFVLALGFGWPSASKPIEPMTIDAIEPGSPAERAGLKEDDVIVRANGKPVRNVLELIEVTSPRAGQPTEYLVERAGKPLPPMTITPKKDDRNRGIIGVVPRVDAIYQRVPLAKASQLAVLYPFDVTVRTLAGMADQIARRTTDGLTGPVGMGSLVYREVKKGVFPFVHVLVVISVALGLFNLLPFPALDGGRLVFLGYELITRRRPNERIEAAVHTVGLLFLLGVIALVTWRDIVRVIVG
jgi:regulator of sigma E protease